MRRCFTQRLLSTNCREIRPRRTDDGKRLDPKTRREASIMTTALRIGTRGSRLALWQANHVADRLRPLAAPRPVELVIIATAGDQVRDVPLAQIGGEGVFTKEIQRALLARSVDVA